MNFIELIETLMLLIAVVLYIKSLKINHNYYAEIVQLKKEMNKVSSLKKTVNPLQNRRKHYRILLKDITCTLKIIDFGHETLRRLNNKLIDGQIADISAGGLGFICEVDFPVTHPVIADINFTLNQETFIYSGIVVRKEAHKGNNKLLYGIQFINMGLKDETQLNFLLNHIELSKTKIN